ncbi:asparagine synthase (glutamine-hydrolyzing) [Alkalicella caledoniensis]|uniref:asparagine synthase (glutamine-hydrolyzing) n=1 Tax=Alkalicella caledoniensis TaxID=2731377 RepID=A0A7G9WAM1_ALKCA|nr:asparagine synthase (glutamine-hydrolyzing) [Alkalicella caledoniensis]QNO15733.1 asparagine synthase (glutamine-hydrolyzing) [Alkalicella caledoniensis]
MCGINGIYNFDLGINKDNSLIKRMAGNMLHRGPDNNGFFNDKRVSLGFRRLSIIDISGANQPISNEDGSLKLLCNGEIYNYKELREMLISKGHRFSTNGDAETIIHLYEEYGKDLVKYLRGMFAFIIYDIIKDKIILGRDHFGIKPLYYTVNDDMFACSSELKSVILTLKNKDIDNESLAYYLTYQYVPLSKTMVKDIFRLLPGHTLEVDKNGVKVERYWQAEFSSVQKPKDEYIEEIKDVLRDSVNVHMQSDVPVGAYLSSGIDSTVITSLMTKIKDINTFSVGFEGKQNECDYSTETARLLKTNHHKWVISQQDYFKALRDYIWYIDEPVADPSAVALYLLSKLASQHVKVVLSGEGADELFGGYRIYAEPQSLRGVGSLPSAVRKAGLSVLKPLPKFYGKNYLQRACTDLNRRFVGNAKIFVDEVKDVLVSIPENYSSPFDLTDPFYKESEHLDCVKRMQLIDINFWMPGNILVKADKMTMANSIELRVPFLDIKVFDVARKIPSEYNITPQTTKVILREAIKDFVPDHIINRPKLGFPVPLAHWIRGDFGKECINSIRESNIGKYINLEYVEKLYNDHKNGSANNARKIWTIYILAMWYKRFILSDIF